MIKTPPCKMIKRFIRSRSTRVYILFILIQTILFYWLSIINSNIKFKYDKGSKAFIAFLESSANQTENYSDQDQPNPVLDSSSLYTSEIKRLMDEHPPLARALGTFSNTANVSYHNHVWVGKKWEALTTNSRACLATHTTVEYLFWLAFQSWRGPMSVAIFTPGTDYAVAVAMVHYLRRCFPFIEESVNFHIMYPKKRPPSLSNQTIVNSELHCSDPEGVNKLLLGLRNEPELRLYPQNHNRNLAKKNCPSDYTMTIDIDMLTPPSLAENLTLFFDAMSLDRPCKKCAFVVPVYEVESTANYRPSNKTELMSLLENGQARRYHIKVWSPNQENSHLELWETMNLEGEKREGEREEGEISRGYHVLYNITSYEEYWEPILIVPYTAPLFDERFIGYGFVRNSQVYELHRRNYKFHVLDNAFLSHRGFQSTKNYSSWRKSQIKKNNVRYTGFMKELKIRMKYEAKEHEL